MPHARADARIAHFTTRRTARCAVLGPGEPTAVRAVWIVLHGYGQLAAGFVAGFAAVEDGTRLIVAPEGLSRFYDARTDPGAHREASVGASWMTREDRLQEIDDQLAWLHLVWEAYRGQVPAGTPLTVLGFSQGAAAASRWVASGRVPAGRLVCWGGAIAPELDLGPRSPLRQVRTTLVAGSRDRFAGPAQVAAERARIERAGFPAAFVTFDGGHRLDDHTLRRLAEEEA
jgi:predicted esterase